MASTVAGGISSTTLVNVGPDAKVHVNVHVDGGTLGLVLGDHPTTVNLIGTPDELERVLEDGLAHVRSGRDAMAVRARLAAAAEVTA